MNNKSSSVLAYEMLQAGKRLKTLNETELIKTAFINEGLPIFEKVIEFQTLYGGISYKIGESYYHGFAMDLFYYDTDKRRYEIRYSSKENAKYFFRCMDYHYAGDIGPCIDEEGKIYDFAMGKFILRANSIDEFLDDEAIKYYFVNKQREWLSRGANFHEVDEFKSTINLVKIARDSFSNNYFEWWTDSNESIFIRINLVNRNALIYCENKGVLFNLYKESKNASIYP